GHRANFAGRWCGGEEMRAVGGAAVFGDRVCALTGGRREVELAMEVDMEGGDRRGDRPPPRRIFRKKGEIADAGLVADISETVAAEIAVDLAVLDARKRVDVDRAAGRPVEGVGDDDVEETVAVDVAHGACRVTEI